MTTEIPIEEMNLWQRIHLAQSLIGWVSKDGEVSFGRTQYNYTSEANLLAESKKIFTEARLGVAISYPTRQHELIETVDRDGKTQYKAFITVSCEMTITNIDSFEQSITVNSFGDGMDSGDKGVYKAMTGAEKYALMKFLLIPTGDDPEGDRNTDKATMTGNRQNRSQAAPKPLVPMNTLIKGVRNKESLTDLDKAEEWMSNHKDDYSNSDRQEFHKAVGIRRNQLETQFESQNEPDELFNPNSPPPMIDLNSIALTMVNIQKNASPEEMTEITDWWANGGKDAWREKDADGMQTITKAIVARNKKIKESK